MAGKRTDVTGTQIGDNNHLTIPIHLGGVMSGRSSNEMDGRSLSVRDCGMTLADSRFMGHPPQIVININVLNSQQPVLSEDMTDHRTIPWDRRAVTTVNRKRKRAALEGADALVPCKKARR